MAEPTAGSDWRWNSNTFGVPPKQNLIAVKQDTDFFPAVHKNFLIQNIGRTEVKVELKYGTKVMWQGVADSSTVMPGQRKILDNAGRPYYVTALNVSNDTDQRAIVHCATSDDKYYLQAAREPGSFDEVKNLLLKHMCEQGLKNVSYIDAGLSGLLSEFFPKNTKNIFEQIQDEIQNLRDLLLTEEILEKIESAIKEETGHYRERIAVLVAKIENGGSRDELALDYIKLAEEFVDFENKFRFQSDTYDYQNVNMLVLPFYSCAILLKVSFYIIGIRNYAELGLNDDDLNKIKYYITSSVNDDTGANKYIEDLYQDRIDYAYDTVLAEDLYDNMMNVRTYIGIHGLEYMNIWNYMIEDPASAGKYFNNDVITYSTFFGRQTPNLIAQAIPNKLSQPLTPALVNKELNKIEYIELYIWGSAETDSQRIGGMQVVFESGDNYTMGTLTKDAERIYWNGAVLNKLVVYGGGSADLMMFYFSDERVLTAGSTNSKESVVFELKDHHIVSIFLSSDCHILKGQAANVSVSYRLNEYQ